MQDLQVGMIRTLALLLLRAAGRGQAEAVKGKKAILSFVHFP